MPTIPSGTKFMGVNPDVNTDERRSSLSNSYQEFYTIDEIVAEASAADTNIYNSDGTLDANRTVDLDSKELIFDNGSVGINVNPSTALHVNALAVPAGEAVARFGVTDSSGYVQIANGTGTNNIFAPLLQGRQVGTSLHSAVGTEGIIDPVDDIGTSPITLFKARLSDFTSPLTRPLFQFTSWSFNVMTILANGNVGIGTNTPAEKLDVNGKTKTTTFQMTTTPALNKALISDASGNGSWTYLPTDIQLAASDESTALTTGSAKVTFRMPYAMTLTAVRASLSTAQASGTIFTVDINEGGTTILSTKLTIDNTEKTSTTAAAPPVISTSALTDDAEITIDIDQIGDGTAKGLKVTLIGTRV